MLLQRFSVPELRSKKLAVHFMFILGIFANLIFIFFGYYPQIMKSEAIKFKHLKVSLSSIVFLVFIFFNILFSIMSLNCIASLDNINDKRISKNNKVKVCVIFLAIFVTLIYTFSLILHNKEGINFKGMERTILNISIIISPYILYILNAFMNLSLFSEIVFLKEIMSKIMDQDYFLSNEESDRFIT